MVDLGECKLPYHAKFSATMESARERIAAFLAASRHEIVIVRNVPEANNTIVSGLTLALGD